MPIKVVCKCGQKFAAKDELAGKVVKCPKCKQPLRVGGAQPAATSSPAQAGGQLEDLFDEVGFHVHDEDEHIQYCPACDAKMSDHAIMCVECGYHLETGKFAKGLGGAAAGPKAEGHAGAADMLLKKAKFQIEAERAEEKELRKQGMPLWMILSGLLAVGALIALGTLLGGDVALASLIVLLIAVPSAVIGAAIGAIFGGLVFQLACFVYNKLAGGESAPAAVPQPEYGGAYKIVFISSAISSVMNFVIGFLIGVIIILALGPEIGQARVNSAVVQVLMNLISLPIALFVMSGVARTALPTKYGRAMLVTLLYMVLGVVIGAIIAAPILLILFMLSVIG